MGLATGQGARALAGAWQRAPKSGASSEVPAFQVVPRRDRNQWRPVRTQGRSSTSQAAGVNEPLGIPTFDGDLLKHLLIVQLEYSNKVGSVIPSLIARNRKRHRTPRCFVPDPTLPFGIAAARRSSEARGALFRSAIVALYAVPRAQRSGFGVAPKSSKRVGRDTGRVFGPGVMGPERLVMGGECGFAERKCLNRITFSQKQTRKIATCAIRVWVLGAK
jgi:hypothetical protein